MPIPDGFRGAATPITNADIDARAQALNCSPAIVRAVAEVESRGGGFLADRRPKILFEAHVFSRLTGHQFDESNPNISSPVWDRSLYGAGGAHQYDRLAEASALAPTEALESASWGRFQIMGFNFRLGGFNSVENYVAAMCASEAAQLRAFVSFCTANRFTRFLQANPPDFRRFAVGYNGAGEAANGYHEKLQAAYERWLAEPNGPAAPQPHPAHVEAAGMLHFGMRGPEVRALQRRLAAAGQNVGVDGVFGNDTRNAVIAFQQAAGLEADGVAGPVTMGALPA